MSQKTCPGVNDLHSLEGWGMGEGEDAGAILRVLLALGIFLCRLVSGIHASLLLQEDGHGSLSCFLQACLLLWLSYYSANLFLDFLINRVS